jgi:hypothetical protein
MGFILYFEMEVLLVSEIQNSSIGDMCFISVTLQDQSRFFQRNILALSAYFLTKQKPWFLQSQNRISATVLAGKFLKCASRDTTRQLNIIANFSAEKQVQ